MSEFLERTPADQRTMDSSEVLNSWFTPPQHKDILCLLRKGKEHKHKYK